MKTSDQIEDCERAVKEIRKVITKRKIVLQEHFVILALNIKYCMIGSPVLVSLGTVNCVEVHIRDIFREAIKRNAYGIIASHNHPSGNLCPSEDDKGLANKIDECGKILDIKVLDHIILTKDKFSSRQEGMWK